MYHVQVYMYHVYTSIHVYTCTCTCTYTLCWKKLMERYHSTSCEGIKAVAVCGSFCLQTRTVQNPTPTLPQHQTSIDCPATWTRNWPPLPAMCTPPSVRCWTWRLWLWVACCRASCGTHRHPNRSSPQVYLSRTGYLNEPIWLEQVS